MTKLIYYLTLLLILIVGVVVWLIFKRNYFNKYKYIRLVRYNDDMTMDVKYIKKVNFNQDSSLLINPKHVFNFKGYQTIVITSKSRENINPLDFEAKFNAKDYQTAMTSKLMQEAFTTLKPNGIDQMKILLIISGLQLLAIFYLLYKMLGVTSNA